METKFLALKEINIILQKISILYNKLQFYMAKCSSEHLNGKIQGLFQNFTYMAPIIQRPGFSKHLLSRYTGFQCLLGHHSMHSFTHGLSSKGDTWFGHASLAVLLGKTMLSSKLILKVQSPPLHCTFTFFPFYLCQHMPRIVYIEFWSLYCSV